MGDCGVFGLSLTLTAVQCSFLPSSCHKDERVKLWPPVKSKQKIIKLFLYLVILYYLLNPYLHYGMISYPNLCQLNSPLTCCTELHSDRLWHQLLFWAWCLEMWALAVHTQVCKLILLVYWNSCFACSCLCSWQLLECWKRVLCLALLRKLEWLLACFIIIYVQTQYTKRSHIKILLGAIRSNGFWQDK